MGFRGRLLWKEGRYEGGRRRGQMTSYKRVRKKEVGKKEEEEKVG